MVSLQIACLNDKYVLVSHWNSKLNASLCVPGSFNLQGRQTWSQSISDKFGQFGIGRASENSRSSHDLKEKYGFIDPIFDFLLSTPMQSELYFAIGPVYIHLPSRPWLEFFLDCITGTATLSRSSGVILKAAPGPLSAKTWWGTNRKYFAIQWTLLSSLSFLKARCFSSISFFSFEA